jgi:prepilin-type N-terminal cleavage/methylation domain-containing protein
MGWKMRNIKSFQNQKGYSLVELIIASVIIVLALAAIMAVANNVRGDQKVSTETDRLNLGFEKALAYAATSQDTSVINNAIIIRTGGVPSDAIQGTTTITTKFGGTTTYGPTSISGMTNNGVGATQTNLDEKSCLNFVKNIGGTFTRVSVNGTIVKDVTDNIVQEAALEAQCANTAAGNIVLWEKIKS